MADNITPELVTNTVALLFEPIGSPPSIREAQLTAILRRPIGVGQTPDGGVVFTGSRDQAEVFLLPNKIDVRYLGGDISVGQDRVPEFLHKFWQLLPSPSVTSYGVNFVLEAAVPQAQKWLGQHLVHAGIAETVGTEVLSNGVSLVFDQPPKRWTIRFETRADSTIVINLNASETAPNLPQEGELSSQIRDQYQQLVEVVRKLGLGDDGS